MSDEQSKLEPGVTYFLVPTSTMQQIHEILRKRPYEEVHRLMRDLEACQLTQGRQKPE